jgi:hypothetical protein
MLNHWHGQCQNQAARESPFPIRHEPHDNSVKFHKSAVDNGLNGQRREESLWSTFLGELVSNAVGNAAKELVSNAVGNAAKNPFRFGLKSSTVCAKGEIILGTDSRARP